MAPVLDILAVFLTALKFLRIFVGEARFWRLGIHFSTISPPIWIVRRDFVYSPAV